MTFAWVAIAVNQSPSKIIARRPIELNRRERRWRSKDHAEQDQPDPRGSARTDPAATVHFPRAPLAGADVGAGGVAVLQSSTETS